MADAATTIPTPSFQTAFAAYNAVAALRDLCRTDEEIDRAEDAIAPIFEAVIEHPLRTLSAIISKCSVICGEYPDGEIPVVWMEAIMFDLMALEVGQTGEGAVQ